MSRLFPLLAFPFRPREEELSPRERSQIQIHRLLTALGAVLIPLFGLLYDISSPEATDPMWGRVLIAGLLAALLSASYVSERIRGRYVAWLRGGVYVIMSWFAFVAVLNGFAGDYAVGLLLVYAVLTAVVGLGAQTLAPVLSFSGFGLFFTAGGFLLTSEPNVSLLILIASMVTLTLIEGLAIRGLKRKQQETQRRSDAMESASDGMAILDSEGVYTYVNQAHADAYGYDSPEDFLGETWKMCYGEEELRRFEEEVMPSLFDEGRWRGRATGRKADGSAFPQELVLNVLEDGGIVCVVRDITDQIERERQLQEAKEEAEEASRLKSAMLANMSHELRTPLTSITGFSEMLEANLEGELEEFASKIHKGSRRLQRTLESVLHLSRLEAGVEELDREELCLGEVVNEVVEGLERWATGKSLSVEIKVPGTPVVGCWNKEAVRRICRNLVENAIKFTPEGGRVQTRVEREDAQAVLRVEDTGIGMDPKNVPELFRAFKQESDGRCREYEGTGLGLSIVKRLTDEIGGEIEVDTEKHEGTCFTVRLPRGKS